MPRKHQKRRNDRIEGFRPSANPEQAKAMALLRRSSAANPHTPRPRKGTRAERERQAIRDQNKQE